MAEQSARLRLRVVPGASRDAVVGRHGDGWKVRVAAPPERGAANRALLRLLADALVVAPASLAVVSGRGGRDKIIDVRGLAEPEVERRLRVAERKEPRP